MKSRRSSRKKSLHKKFASLPSQLTKQYDTYQRILNDGLPRLSSRVLKKRILTIERLVSISTHCYPEVCIACERADHLRRVRELNTKIQDLEESIRSKINIIQAIFLKSGGRTEEDINAKRKLKADLAAEEATEYRTPAPNELINSQGEPLINIHFLASIIDGLTNYLKYLRDALAEEAERDREREALTKARIEANEKKNHKRRAKQEAVEAIAARSQDKSRETARKIKQKIQSKQFEILQICPYCASSLNPEKSHADHIYPIALGGLSTASNMVFVCDTCNLSKRDFTLRDFISRNTRLNSESIVERLTLLGKKF